MLGRHHEERRSEERVGARREDRVVDPEFLAAEGDLRPLAAPDPVSLHGLDVLGPVDALEIVQQPLGVIGDAQEPLLELADFHEAAAALAAAFGVDLLVGEHRLVVGAPLDRRLLAVGQAGAEQLEEDPLRPAVVTRIAGGELPRPVDRDAPRVELATEGIDRFRDRQAWVKACLDRVVLGGQSEGVVSHRVKYAAAQATVIVGECVSHRVGLQVTNVRLAAGIGQHLEHVGVLPGRAVAGQFGATVICGCVGDLPGALVRPDLLPPLLYLTRLVAIFCHRRSQVSGQPATGPREFAG